ncbi:MAG TPA: TetR/AcrR family transcriptional regulator [Rectinemataceae bacterium]|nr:TetR/AcrR family transcriptional regulator [Rectinemataceae bacterium]
MTKSNLERKWTAAFERLSSEKKTRILNAAKCAFAMSGFAGANINKIAESAGISIGSMYKYFRTKEDLFLTLIEKYHEYIALFIDGVLASEGSFAGRVEALLKASVQTSRDDPEAVKLYIACTTEELAGLSSRLSSSIEEVSAVRYRAMVEEAQAKGEVDPSLDSGWTAFFLDDIFLMTQFSIGSDYYRTRLKLFLGATWAAGEGGTVGGRGDAAFDELVPRLLALILRSLAPDRGQAS